MSKIFSIILLSTVLNATGTPYINIKLNPIATNYEGVVLFQTYSDINTNGSYSCTHEKFGWLVVSAHGIWDERVSYDSSEIFDNACNYKDKKKYDAYKKGTISLKNPDQVLKKILHKYYFNRSIAESNERLKVLELKPKQSCFQGKCIDEVLPQKSIDGFLPTKLSIGKAQNLRSSLYYKGVTLMRTPLYENEESILYDKHQNDNPRSYKQQFNLPMLPKGSSYEKTFIDSIVLVKPFDFRQPSNKVKTEVEKVVTKIIELLKKSSLKSIETINDKYIHPKYGFYLLYRMGVCDRIKHYKKLDSKNLPDNKTKTAPSGALSYLYAGEEAKLTPIKWESVSFDCGTFEWSKKGIFIDDNGYDVTSLCDFNAYSNNEKIKIKFLTTDTFVVNMTEQEITFELKKIDGRWYIVLIDGVKTDCSA